MKHLFIFLVSSILLFFPTKLASQENTPHLKGKVKISITEGTFECDLTMNNIPRIEDYLIRLNAGMNVLHFRSKKPNDFVLGYDKSSQDSTSTGESLAYYFPDNTGKDKFLPEEIQFRYVGKFPVATDTIENYSRFDWKGNIAFNGFSIRADGTQSAWYPYIYDAKNDIGYDKMSYDIELICEDCETIYINGSQPIKSSSAKIINKKPYELALFCGNFDFVDDRNIIILNPQFSKDEIQQFSNWVSPFKKYYEQKLSIRSDQPPVFINTTPTAPNYGWLFVSYPTIMGIGYGRNGLGALFIEEHQRWYAHYIAHELVHYYFSTFKEFNSVLGDMISEGFAEYVSLKLVEDLLEIDLYNEKLEAKYRYLEDYETKPIAHIKSISDIEDRETFVYDYAPVIFLAIEKEIGKDKMWEWIKTILITDMELTNYDFLRLTLKSTLIDDEKFKLIEEEYFNNENSTENALKKLKNK
jgi:hypothetical protein